MYGYGWCGYGCGGDFVGVDFWVDGRFVFDDGYVGWIVVLYVGWVGYLVGGDCEE